MRVVIWRVTGDWAAFGEAQGNGTREIRRKNMLLSVFWVLGCMVGLWEVITLHYN